MLRNKTLNPHVSLFASARRSHIASLPLLRRTELLSENWATAKKEAGKRARTCEAAKAAKKVSLSTDVRHSKSRAPDWEQINKVL